jgi:selenocysteine-specific elongation factor
MQQLHIPDGDLVDALVGDTEAVVQDADGIHRPGRPASLPAEIEHELHLMLDRLATHPFAAPEAPELAAAGLTEKVLAVAVRNGRLVRVAPGVYLAPAALDEAVLLLAALPQPFTMAQAREALQTTRRVAVPLLELLDRRGHTRRVDTQHREVTGR